MIATNTSSLEKASFQGVVVSLYISSVFLLAFLEAVFDSRSITTLLLVSMLPGIALFIWETAKSFRKIVLLIIITIVLTVNSIVHQEFYIKFLYFIAFSFWLSVYLRRNTIAIWPFLILLYALAFYVLYFSLIQGLSVNRMFSSGSRNLLSYFCIFLFSYYCLLSYAGNKKIQMIPVLCVVIICVLAIGRTGIILSLVLYLTWLASLLSVKLTMKKISLILLMMISLIFFFSVEISSVFEQFYIKLARLERYGLSNDYRNSMLDYYLSQLDVFNVFFGFKYTESGYFLKWDLNPHNSFIRLHLYSGLISMLSFLILYLFSAYYWFKKSFFMFVVLNVIVLRVYFDTLVFFGPLDFVIFAIILYPIPPLYHSKLVLNRH